MNLISLKKIFNFLGFQIHSKDVNKFQQAYWNLLKTNINGLKKLKKVKSAKPKVH